MKWGILFIAICLEVSGTMLLKFSNGGQKINFIIASILFYGSSLWFLSISLQYLEMNVAYAIWSGLGLVLLTLFQIIIFKDNITVLKVLFSVLIIIGVVGLHFAYNTNK
jgi:small multidrug resistance pump